jgi:hypothetical protein
MNERKEERNQGGDSRILVSIEHGCQQVWHPEAPLEFEIHRTRVCILTKAKGILEEEEESTESLGCVWRKTRRC